MTSADHTVSVRVSTADGWVEHEFRASEGQISACYALPSNASRASYWDRISGRRLPEHTVLVWSLKSPQTVGNIRRSLA